jgi:hypothetical protein
MQLFLSAALISAADHDASTGISTWAMVKGAASTSEVILVTCIWRLMQAGLPPLAVVVYIVLVSMLLACEKDVVMGEHTPWLCRPKFLLSV